MEWPAPNDPRILASSVRPPCLSLYLPFGSAFAERGENALRFGQVVARASDRLGAAGLPDAAIAQWIDQLIGLQRKLWERGRTPQGVGVFVDHGGMRAFKLASPPAERIIVAEWFALRELVHQLGVLQPRAARDAALAADPSRLAISLDRILAAAQRDAISRLWTREGAAIAGRIDERTGRVVSAHGGDDDVLDALAARVLRSGGEVRVVGHPEQMPAAVNAAAELR